MINIRGAIDCVFHCTRVRNSNIVYNKVCMSYGDIVIITLGSIMITSFPNKEV